MIRKLLSAASMEDTLVPTGTVNTKVATALRGEVLFPTIARIFDRSLTKLLASEAAFQLHLTFHLLPM
jgi:hypothetical protein